MKGSDRLLILASRSHPRLQLKVQSGFWLVLPEKSDAGFPVVNWLTFRLNGCKSPLHSNHRLSIVRYNRIVRPRDVQQKGAYRQPFQRDHLYYIFLQKYTLNKPLHNQT
ncbi:hypothetical protein [Nostoc sp.]|uniref:hypothetical protein n=1 Tax=Nostoc sp. TaxID=1180 RepID=UPI002FFBB118